MLRKKRPFLNQRGGSVRKLLLLIPTVILLAIVTVLLVQIFSPNGDETPAQEKKTPMADISIPLPEGWQTKTVANVTVAYGGPCEFKNFATCKGFAVFDEKTLAGSDWKKTLVGLTCAGNPKEKPGKVTPGSAKKIGDHGAFYYTVPLCGVSNTEKVAIWETQIPKRLFVMPADPRFGLSDLDKRLARSAWR